MAVIHWGIRTAWQKPAIRDLIAIVAISVAVGLTAFRLDLYDTVDEFLERHEHYQIDEPLAAVLVLPLLLSVFALRRWLELRREVTRRRALEVELERYAFYDTLTGLPNRALFLDRLSHALARSGGQSEGVAVLFIDLDDFKIVNDSMGHAAGDELLRAVAARITDGLCPGDTVARFGGDEFTILLEDLPTTAEALAVGERLLVRLGEPLAIGGRHFAPGASLGLAVSADDDTANAEQLLQAADTALYQAKAAGKGRVAVFDTGMQKRVAERVEMESDILRALDAEQLTVYYQPQVNTASRQLVGLEALLRWQHPTRGLVGPVEFIPLLEQSGGIVQVGLWVLETACRQVSAHLAHWGGHPFRLSVNLSPTQVNHPDLVSDVNRILMKTGLPPDRLCLEITESVLMDDMGRARETLRRLREVGVHLAIDDFGTGYSSFGYLQHFPVETVKIDRSFIKTLGEIAGSSAIVESVTALAHQLKMEVVAEGVETVEQLGHVRNAGCDQSQGYLFSRPLPPEEALRLLDAVALGRSEFAA